MNDLNLKRPALITIGSMIVLLIGSVVFYKERLLAFDSAFIVFKRLNFDLQKEDMRYGVFITQFLILIGAKLHLSLKLILQVYSASFYVFYISVMYFLYRHKQYALIILLGLYNVLFISDAWFWPHNEVHQGVAWMFLFFSVVLRAKQKNANQIGHVFSFVLLSAIAVFTHPLITVAIIAMWVFFMLDRTIWPYSNKQSIIYSVLLFAVIVVKFYLSKINNYDAGKMQNATHFTIKNILATFKSLFADSFWHDCLTNYWWAIVICCFSLYIAIRQKRPLLILWAVLMPVAFFVLVCLTFGPASYDYHLRFYFESEWAILCLFVAAPFVFYFLPKLNAKAAISLLSAIFIVRIAYIFLALPVFEKRIGFIEKSLAQMRMKKLSKVIVKKDKRIDDIMLMDWGLPYECILASKLAGDDPQLSFLALPEEATVPSKLPPDNKIMVTTFGWEVIQNEYYLRIDSTRPYTVMTYDQFFDR